MHHCWATNRMHVLPVCHPPHTDPDTAMCLQETFPCDCEASVGAGADSQSMAAALLTKHWQPPPQHSHAILSWTV